MKLHLVLFGSCFTAKVDLHSIFSQIWTIFFCNSRFATLVPELQWGLNTAVVVIGASVVIVGTPAVGDGGGGQWWFKKKSKKKWTKEGRKGILGKQNCVSLFWNENIRCTFIQYNYRRILFNPLPQHFMSNLLVFTKFCAIFPSKIYAIQYFYFNSGFFHFYISNNCKADLHFIYFFTTSLI